MAIRDYIQRNVNGRLQVLTENQRVLMLTEANGIPQDLSELHDGTESSQRSKNVNRWLQVMAENKEIRHHIQRHQTPYTNIQA